MVGSIYPPHALSFESSYSKAAGESMLQARHCHVMNVMHCMKYMFAGMKVSARKVSWALLDDAESADHPLTSSLGWWPG
jgi:hypothetical protein